MFEDVKIIVSHYFDSLVVLMNVILFLVAGLLKVFHTFYSFRFKNYLNIMFYKVVHSTVACFFTVMKLFIIESQSYDVQHPSPGHVSHY